LGSLKRPFGKLLCIDKDEDIKMDIREMRRKHTDWIHLA
jgi:hypothetical protein